MSEACPDASAAYDALYEEYAVLHDYFGRGTNEVMHRLRQIPRYPSPADPRGDRRAL